jgi:hypothetical protein
MPSPQPPAAHITAALTVMSAGLLTALAAIASLLVTLLHGRVRSRIPDDKGPTRHDGAGPGMAPCVATLLMYGAVSAGTCVAVAQAGALCVYLLTCPFVTRCVRRAVLCAGLEKTCCGPEEGGLYFWVLGSKVVSDWWKRVSGCIAAEQVSKMNTYASTAVIGRSALPEALCLLPQVGGLWPCVADCGHPGAVRTAADGRGADDMG